MNIEFKNGELVTYYDPSGSLLSKMGLITVHTTDKLKPYEVRVMFGINEDGSNDEIVTHKDNLFKGPAEWF